MKAVDIRQTGKAISATLEDAGRGMRHIRHTMEDAMEETRHTIKSRPLTIVLGAAIAGIVAGVVTGWLLRGHSRS